MTWEQKLQALNALTPTCVKMRAPGNWYVSAYARELQAHDSCILRGEYGNGHSPEEAVENDWKLIAHCSPKDVVLVHATDPKKRRAFRWNGFMWQDVAE